jgi:hypothetical protein
MKFKLKFFLEANFYHYNYYVILLFTQQKRKIDKTRNCLVLILIFFKYNFIMTMIKKQINYKIFLIHISL